jgi:hypothetical protein
MEHSGVFDIDDAESVKYSITVGDS